MRNKIMIYLLFLFCLSSISCATLKGTAKETVTNTSTIEKTETGVKFNTSKPCDMSMKEGETEYKYSGKVESWFSKVMGILTLGVVGVR